MKTERSQQLFAEAQVVIPGGVNSPVRAFRSVGGQPRFIARAKGSRLYDVDGNSYIDYVLSWGPMILGHAPAPVIKALQQAAMNGTSYGAPTELEVRPFMPCWPYPTGINVPATIGSRRRWCWIANLVRPPHPRASKHRNISEVAVEGTRTPSSSRLNDGRVHRQIDKT